MEKFTEIFVDCTSDGTKIPKDEYLEFGKNIIIDQGNNIIAGYTDNDDGLYTDVPAIIFGDHTRIVKYVDRPFFLGADGVKLLKSKKDGANYKYLYYALKNARIPDTGYNRHFKWLKEILIPYPNITRQKKIVTILDKLSSIIEKRKTELDYFDTLIKARFVEMFGDLKTNTKNWPIASFNDCATIDTNMIHEFDGYEEYPHIGIDSIEKDTGRLVGYRTIAEDGVISGKYLFSPRHIIYSKIRPNLNKVALPDFDGLCSADAYPILVKEDVCTREFFGYTLRSSYFLDYILAFSNRTNLPKVNKNQVEGFTLPLPEIGVQRQFSDFVKQVDKSKVAVQRSLEETQKLFNSLMQEYFG